MRARNDRIGGRVRTREAGAGENQNVGLSPTAKRFSPTGVPFTGAPKDGASWIENTGFWVGYPTGASFIVRPDRPVSVRLVLKGGPIANEIAVVSGSWRRDVAIAPNGIARVETPAAMSNLGMPVRVISRRGFRLSDRDPGSVND